nr:MAG: replication associated protein [Cressdnaviricota sp.]
MEQSEQSYGTYDSEEEVERVPRNGMCVHDVTIWDTATEAIKVFFRESSKKWCFQKEVSQMGREHYQCRVSLKIKKRPTEFADMVRAAGFPKNHVTITSNENKRNNFYVIKNDNTFLEGPWKDTDIVPLDMEAFWDMAGTTLRPWQQFITTPRQEHRFINVVVDPVGGAGKSYLTKYAIIHRLGIYIPPLKDFKEVVQFAINMVEAYPDCTKIFMIDIPRAIKGDDLKLFWAGVEQIKVGILCETRYRGRMVPIPSPSVWVFCNTMPDTAALSSDKWRLWKVNLLTQLLERLPLAS